MDYLIFCLFMYILMWVIVDGANLFHIQILFNMPNAAVVVVGDLGRSPRMQYHTLSLANQANFDHVDFIGYGGSDCWSSVEEHPDISLHRLEERQPPFLGNVFVFAKLWKVVMQLFAWFWVLLFKIDRPDYILVQVCFLYCY